MKIELDLSEFYKFADKLADNRLEKTFERITKDIAKALLKRIKGFTPVDGYDLINGWNGNQFLVREIDSGYEVLLVNTTQYALSVNDGHMAKNQYGGPYPIKNRIQVRIPHQWQKGDTTYYVFGHFFVERGILQLNGTKEIEAIIMRELQKWWDGCF